MDAIPVACRDDGVLRAAPMDCALAVTKLSHALTDVLLTCRQRQAEARTQKIVKNDLRNEDQCSEERVKRGQSVDEVDKESLRSKL